MDGSSLTEAGELSPGPTAGAFTAKRPERAQLRLREWRACSGEGSARLRSTQGSEKTFDGIATPQGNTFRLSQGGVAVRADQRQAVARLDSCGCELRGTGFVESPAKRSWRNQANGDTSLRVSALQQPTLEAARLILRPLEQADAPFIQQEASAREIADTMISLPHPYPEGESERYLDEQETLSAQGRGITLAIVTKAGRTFVGLVEIREIDREHSQAELSFWLAQRAWGHGYMSEAVQMVLRYAFRDLGLNRLYAYHMQRNPASGRVLQKNGFHQEGLLRERVRKWDRYEDVLLWAIVRSDWDD